MLTGAINRMLHRKLSMAFEKWQFEAAEMKRAQYFLTGAINRMLHRKLSMAFQKWRSVVNAHRINQQYAVPEPTPVRFEVPDSVSYPSSRFPARDACITAGLGINRAVTRFGKEFGNFEDLDVSKQEVQIAYSELAEREFTLDSTLKQMNFENRTEMVRLHNQVSIVPPLTPHDHFSSPISDRIALNDSYLVRQPRYASAMPMRSPDGVPWP